MVAELVLSGKTVREVADEYSLSLTTIRTWVKNKTPINVKEDTTNLEEILKIKKENARLKEENEILKIKKENARLKEENEILKKAMAIFATK